MKGIRLVLLVFALGAVAAGAQDGMLGKGGKGGGQDPPKSGGQKDPPKTPGGQKEPPRGDQKPPMTPRGNPPAKEPPPRANDRNNDRPPVYMGGQGGLRELPDDSPLRRRITTSRSGSVQYGSNSNHMSQGSRAQPLNITGAPDFATYVDPRTGSIAFRADREDRMQSTRGRDTGRYRQGYWHYDQRWRDDWWLYPYYRFNWIYGQSVCSPWYYYNHLPAYIVVTRVNFNFGSFDVQFAQPYRWRDRRDDYRRGRYSEGSDLDYAIGDIVDVFERADRRALDSLMPRRGSVRIDMDGWRYIVSADDFYDLVNDNVYNTRTERYRILDVRLARGYARVAAEHEFIDPWGRRARVYHGWTLREDRYGWTVEEFTVRQRHPSFW